MPEPRTVVRANFQEVRASGNWLREARTEIREAGIRLPGYPATEKPGRHRLPRLLQTLRGAPLIWTDQKII